MKFFQVLLLCLWLRSTSTTPLLPLCACSQELTVLHSIFLQPKEIVWPGECFKIEDSQIPRSRWTLLSKHGQNMFALTKSMDISICKDIEKDDVYEGCPRIISRAEWGALPPKKRTPLSTPVKYAVVHHSDTPQCTTKSACIRRIKNIQNYHMKTRGWDDIGYNFLVGGDGNVYEGRGWDTKGAHVVMYNSVSLGICVIGDYSAATPTTTALNALRSIVNCLRSKNKVKYNYLLRGHRDLGSTSCPGTKLYNIIKHWPHY
nr:peptidoglycan recognition protein 5 [Sepioteuthis lessoniana]